MNLAIRGMSHWKFAETTPYIAEGIGRSEKP